MPTKATRQLRSEIATLRHSVMDALQQYTLSSSVTGNPANTSSGRSGIQNHTVDIHNIELGYGSEDSSCDYDEDRDEEGVDGDEEGGELGCFYSGDEEAVAYDDVQGCNDEGPSESSNDNAINDSDNQDDDNGISEVDQNRNQDPVSDNEDTDYGDDDDDGGDDSDDEDAYEHINRDDYNRRQSEDYEQIDHRVQQRTPANHVALNEQSIISVTNDTVNEPSAPLQQQQVCELSLLITINLEYIPPFSSYPII